jgi:hypothetical protein
MRVIALVDGKYVLHLACPFNYYQEVDLLQAVKKSCSRLQHYYIVWQDLTYLADPGDWQRSRGRQSTSEIGSKRSQAGLSLQNAIKTSSSPVYSWAAMPI